MAMRVVTTTTEARTEHASFSHCSAIGGNGDGGGDVVGSENAFTGVGGSGESGTSNRFMLEGGGPSFATRARRGAF